MRRVVLDVLLSLDGFFTDPKDQIDWFTFDEESMAWSRQIMEKSDTILFGRTTYEMMASYWPTADRAEPLTDMINARPKIVFSKSLTTGAWPPSTVVREDPAKTVARLREKEGKDILVLGSSSVASALAAAGLIDEYRLRYQPVFLGQGRPLFYDQPQRRPLRLVSVRSWPSGVVAAHYEPAPAGAANTA